MSKGLSEETKYEFDLFGRELNKDLTNLMELLRKQNEDNKAILYAGRHIQKIVLPVEEYQKMCQRLEAIDNSKPSEALGSLKDLRDYLLRDRVNISTTANYKVIEQALIKAQEQKNILKIIKEKCLHNDNLNYVSVCINYDMYKEKMSNKHDTEVVKIDWNDEVLLDYLKLLKKEEFDLLKRYFK